MTTNFKTTGETRKAIKKIAEENQERALTLYHDMSRLATGLMSACDIDYKKWKERAKIIDNAMKLIAEYRADINTLHGRGLEDMQMAYITPDLRVSRPERIMDPKSVYCGFQEVQEYMNEKWEGYVTMIKTEEGLLKKRKEYEENL